MHLEGVGTLEKKPGTLIVIKKHAAVFLDRDGTLIRDVGYLRGVPEIEVLPGVAEGLGLLRKRGFKVVLVTNQSGVGRGFLTEAELHEIHDELQRKLGAFDGMYYCPHHPTEAVGVYRIACECRKPGGGMVERACRDLNIDPRASYVIGDRMIDMEMASRVGAKGVLLDHRGCAEHADSRRRCCARCERNFYRAVHWILEDSNAR